MNTEWSNINKDFQTKLKRNTFDDAIGILLNLREELFHEIYLFTDKISKDEFSLVPFINHKGYESKSVIYSIWHIFRIEDIVLNSLILNNNEIYYTSHYDKTIGASINTTGNELVKEEIKDFSLTIDIEQLYQYINEVYLKTNKWLNTLNYDDLSKRFNNEDVKRLIDSNSISLKEAWLIEYWTSKDIKGLLLMPFSRHWIMHIEASLRIIDKIVKIKK